MELISTLLSSSGNTGRHIFRRVVYMSSFISSFVSVAFKEIFNKVFCLDDIHFTKRVFNVIFAAFLSMFLKIFSDVSWKLISDKYNKDDSFIKILAVSIYILGKFLWRLMIIIVIKLFKKEELKVVKAIFTSASIVLSSINEALLLRIDKAKKAQYRKKFLDYEITDEVLYPLKYIIIESIIFGSCYGCLNALGRIIITILYCWAGVYGDQDGECLSFVVYLLIILRGMISGIVYNITTHLFYRFYQEYQKDKNVNSVTNKLQDVETKSSLINPDVSLVTSVADIAK